MNHFEQSIPKKSTEVDSQHFENKREKALLIYEQEKAEKKRLEAEDYAPFEKPIKEAFDSKSHNREDAISRQELDFRLVEQYADTINGLKEKWKDEPDQFRKEVLENEIITQQTKLEEILSKVSPKEFEENNENIEK